jgi:dimethylhistidine N-methyltransferase
MINSQTDEPRCISSALTPASFRRDVLAGLSRPRKTLPCKYLYDEQGARLFEAICELEEYYPTRTEVSILKQNIDEIAALVPPCSNLVDLGSGNSVKTRLLLAHLDRLASCLPVDVSQAQLAECSASLARDFAGVEVHPICADYTRDFTLPDPLPGPGPVTVFFPGSTIGNFEPEEARMFLQRLARLCGTAGGVLVGVDLKKAPQVLHGAYNDAQGITAQFNLNLLVRANRELGTGFKISQFRHQALYNAAAGRIEMHLVSRQSQTVPVDGRRFAFSKGESIVTEHSYKYTLEEFRQLAARAGFEAARSWTDAHHWFSVHYLRPRANQAHRNTVPNHG